MRFRSSSCANMTCLSRLFRNSSFLLNSCQSRAFWTATPTVCPIEASSCSSCPATIGSSRLNRSITPITLSCATKGMRTAERILSLANALLAASGDRARSPMNTGRAAGGTSPRRPVPDSGPKDSSVNSREKPRRARRRNGLDSPSRTKISPQSKPVVLSTAPST